MPSVFISQSRELKSTTKSSHRGKCTVRKKTIMRIVVIVIILIFNLINEIRGHGMVMVPAGRGTRWRTDRKAPINYDDNGSNCGGFANQWFTWNGLCGICGDPYQQATPRSHELGGWYGGSGVIVANYSRGAAINVTVKVTANHLGKFLFDICNLDNGTESESCFEQHELLTVDGRAEFEIGRTVGDIVVPLQLPEDLRCNHCVLRWTYICGNNWGFCATGGGKLGCGPQEYFRTCSDIMITDDEERAVEID